MRNALFTIHGTRGTAPVSGPAVRRHGGHTTCFSLETPRGILVVDAGTGLASLGDRLMGMAALPPITLLFTHLHLDHVMGLPLFKPLYRRDASITLMADPGRIEDWPAALRGLVAPPFWPLRLESLGARIRFQPLPAPRRRMTRHGIGVQWQPLRHPQQCLAYRLTFGGSSAVIVTDHEPGLTGLDRRLVGFCRQADVLAADAQYTESEWADHRGWGHGTWRACARLAAEAGVRRLLLTHHDRLRTDAQVDASVRRARRIFPNTRAARDGLRVWLPGRPAPRSGGPS